MNPPKQPEPSANWIDQLVDLDEKIQRDEIAPNNLSAEDLRTATRLLFSLKNLANAVDEPAFAGTQIRVEKFGPYTLQSVLGFGGCAIVYLAFDELHQRQVALKIPLPLNLLRGDVRQQFVQEAQAGTRLAHPHIVQTFEAGEIEQVPFIATEYCSGPTLLEWLRKNGALTPMAAAKLMSQLADAVQYSHDQGILHRDLKPANVLLYPNAADNKEHFHFIPRLSDFGMSKLIELVNSSVRSSVIVGTPLYMAPEQVDERDGRSGPSMDVFGLGAILYESLVNRPPFSGSSIFSVINTIRSGERITLQMEKHIPQDLAAICEKCLSIDPADRYSSAAEVKQELDLFLASKKISTRRRGFLYSLQYFLKSKQRIREAVGFVVLSHAAILLWIVAWPLGILLRLPMTEGTTLAELVPFTAPLIGLHLLSIGLGWGIHREKTWAAVSSMFIGVTLSVFQLAVLARWISPPYPSIYPDVRTRDIVFLLLFSIFVMQSILCTCAWRALRRSGN